MIHGEHLAHRRGGARDRGLALGHIYMGTIGVEGAYRNMRYGYVDETWAREHHEYWYEDVKSGKVKAAKATGAPDRRRSQH